MEHSIIGMDISKDQLDICVFPSNSYFSVPRNSEGIAQMLEKLEGQKIKLFVMEATGGYEQLVIASLTAAGLPVALANPAQVRSFANALGQYAKTDRLDAKVIAHFAQALGLAPHSFPESDIRALSELVHRRKQLTDMIGIEQQRAKRVFHSLTQQSVQRMQKTLEEEIKKIDDQIKKQIAASKPLAEKNKLLTSLPGIGRVISSALIAQLPELGILDHKKIAALVGVAPFTQQSGQWKGKSKIKGGRSYLRRLLFLAALAASRSNPVLNSFKQKLLDAGKPKMVALIAVARKLLVMANAILRTKQPFNLTYPQQSIPV